LPKNVILSMIDNINCFHQPWQAFEKTLVRPGVADFAPRRFSLALARLGSKAHLRGFGIVGSFKYRCARDYGEVFYTVKTTYSIKNET